MVSIEEPPLTLGSISTRRGELMTHCAYCGVQIEQHEGRGRPATYCGPACRRLVASALRTIVQKIDRIDGEITSAERQLRGTDSCADRERVTEKLTKLIEYRADIAAEHDEWIRRSQGEVDARAVIAERAVHR
jgi:hypothetical protein